MPSREYAARHPERWLMFGRMQQLNKRAARAMVPGKLTLEDGFWMWEQGEGICVFCGSPATEFDHGTPLSRGGWNTTWNIQLTCRPCNAKKGQRTNAEYIAGEPTGVCRGGHKRTAENTYVRRTGAIECATCRRQTRGIA